MSLERLKITLELDARLVANTGLGEILRDAWLKSDGTVVTNYRSARYPDEIGRWSHGPSGEEDGR